MFTLPSSPFIASVRALQTNDEQVSVHMCLYMCPLCVTEAFLPDIVITVMDDVVWASSLKNQGITDAAIPRPSAVELEMGNAADEF